MMVLSMIKLQLVLLSLSLLGGDAFLTVRGPSATSCTTRLSSFAVSAATLEQNLTESEKSVTGVVRNAGPSVAFVTSVWPAVPSRRRRTSSSNALPPGRPLGSGSGFVVESDGYVVTNYHVIEQAYQLQTMQRKSQERLDEFIGNLTFMNSRDFVESLVNRSSAMQPPPPKVYCRINGASQHQLCRIVSVQPDLDVAVLKIENSTTTWSTVDFGVSAELLVGQSLVAIGNPFGVGQTVTSGVVSALNREISTSKSGVIRDCIQTDAAINPGNSGGPLLNLDGQVIGVNTAIITTSGSNAGIGFAIPSDKVQPVVRDMIRKDRRADSARPNAGYLGVGIVKVLLKKPGNWILTVDPQSPAAEADLKILQILDSGRVVYGDAIVAVASNFVETYEDLVAQLDSRVQGEELALTVEDGETGERRVLYIKLGSKPQAP